MYSSTCFGRTHAHHQELNNCSSSLWSYRWSVVIAVLLVVVRPVVELPISKLCICIRSVSGWLHIISLLEHYRTLLCVYYFSYYVCITLVVVLLGRSQYPEGPTPGHLGTGFSWFPCVYKRMLRWFPRLQVATACFSCSPPDLNFLHP